MVTNLEEFAVSEICIQILFYMIHDANLYFPDSSETVATSPSFSDTTGVRLHTPK